MNELRHGRNSRAEFIFKDKSGTVVFVFEIIFNTPDYDLVRS